MFIANDAKGLDSEMLDCGLQLKVGPSLKAVDRKRDNYIKKIHRYEMYYESKKVKGASCSKYTHTGGMNKKGNYPRVPMTLEEAAKYIFSAYATPGKTPGEEAEKYTLCIFDNVKVLNPDTNRYELVLVEIARYKPDIDPIKDKYTGVLEEVAESSRNVWGGEYTRPMVVQPDDFLKAVDTYVKPVTDAPKEEEKVVEVPECAVPKCTTCDDTGYFMCPGTDPLRGGYCTCEKGQEEYRKYNQDGKVKQVLIGYSTTLLDLGTEAHEIDRGVALVSYTRLKTYLPFKIVDIFYLPLTTEVHKDHTVIHNTHPGNADSARRYIVEGTLFYPEVCLSQRMAVSDRANNPIITNTNWEEAMGLLGNCISNRL